MQSFRAEAEQYFRDLRDRIVARLSAMDGGDFQRKAWQRPEGGGGEISQIRGALFEKGGCNFSAVWGDRYPTAPGGGAQAEGRAGGGAQQTESDVALGIRPPRPEELAGKPFFATGISLVLHPRNPFVPVVHMNVRYLEAGELCWFGGGADLTPCKPFPEDTRHFHDVLRAACDKHGAARYPRFSQWAREYFYLQHRRSERGVGGIFFDYLRSCRPTRRWWSGGARCPTETPTARSCFAGAAATWSSTCSTTAGRSSASRAAATWRRSS
jgi:coproporphyrinogen III oxidase